MQRFISSHKISFVLTVDLDTTSTSEIDTAKAMERVSRRDAIRFYVSQAFLSN